MRKEVSADGKWHTVAQGESVSSLAHANGLFWRTVWDHPENASLMRLRKQPNVLYPGDRVFIPKVRLKESTAASDQAHRFYRKGVPEKLALRFLDLEKNPLGGEPYTLVIDGKETRGQLDGDGFLRAPIPPGAREAHVEVGENGEFAQMDLKLGHLDPVEEISGVQGRLKNLGYYDGLVDGKDREELREAVRRFRRDNKLSESAEIDDSFLDSLQQAHKV